MYMSCMYVCVCIYIYIYCREPALFHVLKDIYIFGYVLLMFLYSSLCVEYILLIYWDVEAQSTSRFMFEGGHYIYIYIYIYIHVCIHVCVHLCIHIYIYTYISISIYVYVCVYIYIYICIYISISLSLYIYIYLKG